MDGHMGEPVLDQLLLSLKPSISHEEINLSQNYVALCPKM